VGRTPSRHRLTGWRRPASFGDVSSGPVPGVTEVHPDVTCLSFLLGTWVGEGKGMYPTIEAFSYREEVSFSHVGKPFLSYSQRTWSPDGRPLHSEAGYWRAGAGGHIELVLAHPSGIVEVEEGILHGQRLELSSRFIGHTSTAKEISTLARSIYVNGDTMTYTLLMGAVGQRAQQHLMAQLRRT
jgi:THAP4-like, heme-binding beta-barrel domain